MVLLNSVLTSIPVYWMSLAPLPAAVLRKLRRLMFSFLWGSSDIKKKFHLVNWNDLSWPKKCGGWGIKNLYWFNLSLRLKNIWRILHSDGLWSAVIHTKYLNGIPIIDWLKKKNFSTRRSSLFWRGFVQVLPWLGTCLTWKVGDGNNILLALIPLLLLKIHICLRI